MSIPRRVLEEREARRAAADGLIEAIMALAIHDREEIWRMLARQLSYEDRDYLFGVVAEAVEAGTSRRRRGRKTASTSPSRATQSEDRFDAVDRALAQRKASREGRVKIVAAICDTPAGDRHDFLRRLIAAGEPDDLAILLDELASEHGGVKRRASTSRSGADSPVETAVARPSRSKFRPLVVDVLRKSPQGASKNDLAMALGRSAELAERLLREAEADGDALYDAAADRWYPPMSSNLENLVKHVVRQGHVNEGTSMRQIVDFAQRHWRNLDPNAVASMLDALCRTGEVRLAGPNKYVMKVGPVPFGGTPEKPAYSFSGVGVVTRHPQAETRLLTAGGQEVISDGTSRSMREMVRDALRNAGRPLTTRDIILEVQARDSRKKDASIKAEVARMVDAKEIRASGKASRGYFYVLHQ